jgi:hypothetical protein
MADSFLPVGAVEVGMMTLALVGRLAGTVVEVSIWERGSHIKA